MTCAFSGYDLPHIVRWLVYGEWHMASAVVRYDVHCRWVQFPACGALEHGGGDGILTASGVDGGGVLVQ